MISVVIPALNEAERLPGLLAALACQPLLREVIVVDGGSRDTTPALARAGGAVVLETAAGRGRQLRHGAAAARGEVILFLHADSIFPETGLGRIAERLAARPELVGGNFRIVFDGEDGFSRWLTGFYAWFRRRGLYYGDSGIFVRRRVYEALGGIRPIALMEDYDFGRRLERYGPTCCIEEAPLVSSSRRFAGRHPAAIVAGWLWLHVLYYLGVSPETLARLYRSARS
ncbi:MAG: TIGR04283 family arsenosugar biosynthesis glycosyltransferase [Alphaproteobacteria bacterium]|jgi:rSAM/selenodomain-associated transferase 2|nr:TIGR04283 family arsenosugar biosynthesis glycosyltransferase [Alphaproteobacteria bacterium]